MSVPQTKRHEVDRERIQEKQNRFTFNSLTSPIFFSFTSPLNSYHFPHNSLAKFLFPPFSCNTLCLSSSFTCNFFTIWPTTLCVLGCLLLDWIRLGWNGPRPYLKLGLLSFLAEVWIGAQMGTPVNIIVGSHVWVEDPVEAWIDGQVVKINAQKLRSRLPMGRR